MEHIWVRSESGNCLIGLTDIGVELIGELVSLAPKGVGQEIGVGQSVATVESSKWVGPISTPIGGVILEVNDSLVKNPARVNGDPYSNWIVKLKPTHKDFPHTLLTGSEGAEEYLKAASRDLSDMA
ncbi:MAG: hypothetical protein V3S16_12050 [Candidatus Desulfatibia sp.]|uniref:hypothetical protein n=1 Tax=Candidatus Desulfatibia sp. TaxID=3101189 RepID=UPI002F31DEDB